MGLVVAGVATMLTERGQEKRQEEADQVELERQHETDTQRLIHDQYELCRALDMERVAHPEISHMLALGPVATRSKIGRDGPSAASHARRHPALPRRAALDQRAQDADVERLLEDDVVVPQKERLRARGEQPSRDEHNPVSLLRKQRCQMPVKLDPIHPRHRDVAKDHVEALSRAEAIERFGRVPQGDDVIRLLEHPLEDSPNEDLVVDDEDARAAKGDDG
jgi:hypothetical protein